MRTILQRILLACSIILLVGCSKYLDIKPFGKVVPKTPEEYATLLHKRLHEIDYGNDQYCIGNFSELINLTMYADNFEACLEKDGRVNKVSVVQDLDVKPFQRYNKLYEIIRDCNIVIENVKPEGGKEYEEVVSAAYALRGICYYQLLRQFCEAPKEPSKQMGVPVVVSFNLEDTFPRGTMEETISRIENDFYSSLKYQSNPEFRFSKDVVNGYLARLFFWTEQWSKAKEISKKLLDKYQLIEGKAYTDMLDQVYEMSGNMLIKSNIYKDQNNTQVIENIITNLKKRPVSKRYVDCFYDEKDKDIRYTHFIGKKRESNKKLTVNMRAAELLMIQAESEYHLGNNDISLALINSLRSKRVQDAVPFTMDNLPELRESELIKVDATGKPMTKLLNLILTERRKELFQEGDRWFELKRNGTPEFWQSIEGLKYVTKPYMYTYPIPIADLRLVKELVQNPGYTEIIR